MNLVFLKLRIFINVKVETSSVSIGNMISQLLSVLTSLLAFLNPLRLIVKSLEKSADRLEKLYSEELSDQKQKLVYYSDVSQFAKDFKHTGLHISITSSASYMHCSTCTKYQHRMQIPPSCCKWVDGQGHKVSDKKKRDWNRHLDSNMHKEALELSKQPLIQSVFSRASERAKIITMNFLLLSYSSILMFIPYRKMIRLWVSLGLCF